MRIHFAEKRLSLSFAASLVTCGTIHFKTRHENQSSNKDTRLQLDKNNDVEMKRNGVLYSEW